MTDHKSQAVENFRQHLITRIDRGDISVSDLARKSKMDRSTLSDFIHGKGGITLAKADNIARTLGSPLAELLSQNALSEISDNPN